MRRVRVWWARWRLRRGVRIGEVRYSDGDRWVLTGVTCTRTLLAGNSLVLEYTLPAELLTVRDLPERGGYPSSGRSAADLPPPPESVTRRAPES